VRHLDTYFWKSSEHDGTVQNVDNALRGRDVAGYDVGEKISVGIGDKESEFCSRKTLNT
jgi:hypothetical protein